MGDFQVTCIIDGRTYERKVSSLRLSLAGEALLVGSAETVSDTLARMFHEIADLRKEIDSDH